MIQYRTPESHTICWLILLAIGLVARSRAPAAETDGDWPQFHGPRRDNISTETGLLKKWPEGGPQRLWTAQGIGHGFATVAIVGGRIYTSGNIDEKTVVSALDLDGRIVWQTETGPSWEKPVPGTRSTPTIDEGRLYHLNPRGLVVCLDAESGKQLWTRDILKDFGSKNVTWAVSESLLIDGDRLICRPGGPRAAMVALDKLTGRTVWKSPSADGDLAGYSSPALAECGGLRILLALTDKAFIGVNADSGDLLWRFPHKTPFDENITMPVYHDGQVLISTRTTGTVMLKIDVDGPEASVRELWRSDELDNQHGGVILLDGHVYGSCHIRNRASWVCLNWKTGEPTYVEKGVGKGSATYADGMLYTFDESGTMGLVPATPSGHKVVSQFDIPEDGEGRTWAHPVVHNGRLYIRHGDFLYVYDVRATN